MEIVFHVNDEKKIQFDACKDISNVSGYEYLMGTEKERKRNQKKFMFERYNLK